MKKIFIISAVLFISSVCNAQFAPQAGLAGSTAINKDSSIIVEWASNCKIKRGWLDIADTTLGKTTIGDSTNATGMADGGVVSLGDGGEAIFQFDNAIVNGPGFDFAVFENGFLNPVDSNLAFLELATVEISNNGVTYFKFSPACHNDTTVQIAGAGDYMDARKINNLAGKYISNYGTPFDLDEMTAQLGLDVNNIHYVKVKDVTGSLNNNFCTREESNFKINDPYPTAFPSGGFDLDAMAVINHKFPTAINNTDKNEVVFYPNPCSDIIYIKNISQIKSYKIFSTEGNILRSDVISNSINISELNSGIHFLQIENNDGSRSIFRFFKI